MKKIKITLCKKEPILKLPDSWPIEDLKALLKLMDLDLDSVYELNEVEEMSYMALSEYSPQEAAAIVLTFLLGDYLEEGQINNMSHEMLEQKMWEEYPDVSLHQQIFSANYLLYQAFNGKFPRPSAEKITLKLEGIRDNQILNRLHDQEKEICLEVLLGAFEDNALIYRLYEEQIRKGELSEPALFIWHRKLIKQNEDLMLELIASTYWLDDLLDHAEYEMQFENQEAHS